MSKLMIKIGIFILPNKKFKKTIIKSKKEVKKYFGHQKYVDHLPHCTLCVLDVSKKIFNDKSLKKEIYIKKKINFKIKKIGVFFNDPITNGDTIFFKVDKNKILTKLQLYLLKTLKKYRINKKIYFKKFLMRKNYSLYGYPFVNSNWNPHFTIASISKNKSTKNFIKSFININKKILTQNISKVYFYKINKNSHKLLWSVKIL